MNPGKRDVVIIPAKSFPASHNPGAAAILTCLFLFLFFFSSSTVAYYKSIPLEPVTEVIVRFQQEAGAEKQNPRQWGICSTGNPNRPIALALRPLGPQALHLFLLATEYPLRTYLDQTPLETNLRYIVGQRLRDEAKLKEDLRRLNESRKHWTSLLKELGIKSSFYRPPEPLQIPSSSSYEGVGSANIRSPQSMEQQDVQANISQLSSTSTNFYAGYGSSYHQPSSRFSARGVDFIRRTESIGGGPSAMSSPSPSMQAKDSQNTERKSQQHRKVDLEAIARSNPFFRFCWMVRNWITQNWELLLIGIAFLGLISVLGRRS